MPAASVKLRPIIALGLLAAVCAPEHSSAAPQVRVEARTSIELESVQRTTSGIVVRGRVLDANSDEALTARIIVRVADQERRTISDEDGGFEVPFNLRGEKFDIEVTSTGPYLGESQRTIAGFEVSKRPLDLTLSIGPVTTREVVAVLRASSEDNAVPGLSAPLMVDGQKLGRITTDEAGRGEVRLARKGLLAQPGRKSFEVRYRGDQLYDPAVATASELLVVETEIDVEVESNKVDFEDSIEVDGILQDTTGRAVKAARVDLESASSDVLDSAVTGDDGRFRLEVDADELGTGSYTMQVVFDSPQPWFESSRSQAFTVEVAEPQPIPVAYTLGAFGTTAFALLAFVSLRTRPWQKWRRHQDEEEEEVIEEGPVERPVVGGLQQARPSLISTIRRANDCGFSAIVRDAVTRKPLTRARLIVTMGEDIREVETDENGVATFEDLTPGLWQAEARAAFFVTERFSVTVPHRGELRGAHIDMVPVRERIFDLYRQAALPLLPRAELWGIWTPRQIIEHVRGSSELPALAALTNFVEESYFSQRTPVEAVLPRALELVRAAADEAGQ